MLSNNQSEPYCVFDGLVRFTSSLSISLVVGFPYRAVLVTTYVFGRQVGVTTNSINVSMWCGSSLVQLRPLRVYLSEQVYQSPRSYLRPSTDSCPAVPLRVIYSTDLNLSRLGNQSRHYLRKPSRPNHTIPRRKQYVFPQ